MKALSLYPKAIIELRQLMAKLESYGTFNCDFGTFCTLYCDWHNKRFPGRPVSMSPHKWEMEGGAWFRDLINYLANADIEPAQQ